MVAGISVVVRLFGDWVFIAKMVDIVDGEIMNRMLILYIRFGVFCFPLVGHPLSIAINLGVIVPLNSSYSGVLRMFFFFSVFFFLFLWCLSCQRSTMAKHCIRVFAKVRF